MARITKSENYSYKRVNIPYSDYPTLDFEGASMQTMVMSGAFTGFQTENRSSASELKCITLELNNSGETVYPISFNSSKYSFLGGVPTGLKTGSVAYLSIASVGTGENQVIVTYDEVGADLFFTQGAVIFARDYSASGNAQLTFEYPNDLTGTPQLTISGDFSPKTSGDFIAGSTTKPFKSVTSNNYYISGGQQIGGILDSDLFSGSTGGNQTGYTMSHSVNHPRDILVINDGLTQIPTTDYLVDSTTLNFKSAPLSGEMIDVRYFKI